MYNSLPNDNYPILASPSVPLPLPSTSVRPTNSSLVSLDDKPPVDLPPFTNTKVPPPPYLADAPPLFPPPHFSPQFPPCAGALLHNTECPILPSVSDPEDAMTRNRAASSIAIDWATKDARVGNYSSAFCLLENAVSMLKQSTLADDVRTKFLTDTVEYCLCVLKEQKRVASVEVQSGPDDDRQRKLEFQEILSQMSVPDNSDQSLDVKKTAAARGVKTVAVPFIVMVAIVMVAVFLYPSLNL